MRFLNLFRLRKSQNRFPGDTEGDGSDPGSERKTEKESSERRRRENESRPPDDDCCSICFGNFTVPCRAPCGHWYCGDCILQYWNHGAALKPCKCPMCSQPITRLIPEASFDHCQDVEVLQNVRKYNRVFVGGTYGLILKVLESPFLIKRIIRELMDPDAANNHLFKVRLFAVKFVPQFDKSKVEQIKEILLGALYSVCHFDFLPTGRMDAINFFDNFAIGVVLILYMIGLYRRWRRLRLVRQLAIAQP
ncbi:hypothetical protein RHSIM_Rhsim11G0127600 [Rhododendron simsii]|uniref:RING-type domain-containing protein n=1 Tax=Rhododendron simsii TaxID=118357 RepID=A0A834GBR5_RHOSS|nr:hypothetical protein RHSIM_Rhsim11G0127600 [Rhododendron simsii]